MPFLTVALLAMSAALAPARAQSALPASSSWTEIIESRDVRPVQIPLTSSRIELFLSSLPVVLDFIRRIDPLGAQREPAIDSDFALRLTPHLLDPQREAEADALVAQFGFASYADWANTSHSISLLLDTAFVANTMDLLNQEEAALRQIDRSTTLSVDEKARARKELKSQFSALAEFQPLPGNREVAAPYMNSLRAAVGR